MRYFLSSICNIFHSFACTITVERDLHVKIASNCSIVTITSSMQKKYHKKVLLSSFHLNGHMS